MLASYHFPVYNWQTPIHPLIGQMPRVPSLASYIDYISARANWRWNRRKPTSDNLS